MNKQNTYLGKSAGQWLAKSEICESLSGLKQIFVSDGVVANYHPEGMLLESASGSLAILTISIKQNRRFCELLELRDCNK